MERAGSFGAYYPTETTEAATAGGAKKIGVLATPGGEALYTKALQGKGAKIVRLSGAAREAFMACVYAVKRGDLGEAPRAEMRRLAALLVAGGIYLAVKLFRGVGALFWRFAHGCSPVGHCFGARRRPARCTVLV